MSQIKSTTSNHPGDHKTKQAVAAAFTPARAKQPSMLLTAPWIRNSRKKSVPKDTGQTTRAQSPQAKPAPIRKP